MGYRLNRTYHLEFEGAMEGAWVKLKSTPLGVVIELRGGDDTSSSLTNRRAAELLAEYITDWNFDDEDGGKLPITTEAILGDLEQVVVTKICIEWLKAATGQTAPLDPPGADGTLDDADIPVTSIN